MKTFFTARHAARFCPDLQLHLICWHNVVSLFPGWNNIAPQITLWRAKDSKSLLWVSLSFGRAPLGPREKAVVQLEDQFEALGHRGSWKLVEVGQLEVEVVVPCAPFQNFSLHSCQFVIQSLTLAQQASFKPCNCVSARASIPC